MYLKVVLLKKKKIKIPSQSSADSVIITFTNMAVNVMLWVTVVLHVTCLSRNLNVDDFQIKMCMMTLTYFQGHQS